MCGGGGEMISRGQRKEFVPLENLHNHHGEFEGIRNQFINLDCDSDYHVILQKLLSPVSNTLMGYDGQKM